MRFLREKFALLPALFFGTVLLSANAHVDDAEIEVVGNRITVKTEVVLYGPGATRATVDRIQTHIDDRWKTHADGKPWTYVDPETRQTYTVEFDTRISLYDGKEKQNPNIIWGAWNPSNRKNYVKVLDTEIRSYVSMGDEGTWEADDPCWAHEFGHLLGLKDRYTDKKDSDGNVYSESNAGWESNIMADSRNGVVEQRNVDPIAARVVAHRKIRRGNSLWPQRGEPNVFHDEIDIDRPKD